MSHLRSSFLLAKLWLLDAGRALFRFIGRIAWGLQRMFFPWQDFATLWKPAGPEREERVLFGLLRVGFAPMFLMFLGAILIDANRGSPLRDLVFCGFYLSNGLWMIIAAGFYFLAAKTIRDRCPEPRPLLPSFGEFTKDANLLLAIGLSATYVLPLGAIPALAGFRGAPANLAQSLHLSTEAFSETAIHVAQAAWILSFTGWAISCLILAVMISSWVFPSISFPPLKAWAQGASAFVKQKGSERLSAYYTSAESAKNEEKTLAKNLATPSKTEASAGASKRL